MSKSDISSYPAKKSTPWHLNKNLALQAEELLEMPAPILDTSSSVTNAFLVPSYKGATHATYLTPLMVFDLSRQADWKSDPEILAREWRDLFDRKKLIDHIRISRETFGKLHALERSETSEHWRKIIGRHFDRSNSRFRTDDEDAVLRARIETLRQLAEEDDLFMSPESANFVIDFVIEKNLVNPSVVLTNKGDCRAIWRRVDFSFEVDFFSDQRLSVLYSRSHSSGPPGRYAAVDTSQAIVDRWVDVFYDLRNKG